MAASLEGLRVVPVKTGRSLDPWGYVIINKNGTVVAQQGGWVLKSKARRKGKEHVARILKNQKRINRATRRAKWGL